MRAWENRPDCEVVDEPLYAFYLSHVEIDHPGHDEIVRSRDRLVNRIADTRL